MSVGALANHWLNGEHVAHLHLARFVILGVQDVGCAVECFADPMATESCNAAVSERGDVIFNDGANAIEWLPRLAVVDRCLPAVVRCLDKSFAFLIHVSHQICLGAVAVVAPIIASDVDIDNVPILELVAVGDAMANHLIHRGAARLGEAVVVERTRVRSALDRLLVHQSVYVVRSHAGGDGCPREIQHFARDPPSCPHAFDVLVGLDFDLPRQQRAAALRLSVTRVVGTHNLSRNFAPRRNFPRPQLASVLEAVLLRGRPKAAAQHVATHRRAASDRSRRQAPRGGGGDEEHREHPPLG
mmetsp:Transcript_1609/g.4066  ORF Transcript_1609/g.4066 Transcript_1609/m.4066 type:complete len:300 (+) Transcript_1609:226-1125(+)